MGRRNRQRTHTQWRVRSDDVDATLDTLSGAGSGAVTTHGHPLASLVWGAPVALVDPGTGSTYEGDDADAFGGFAVDGYGRPPRRVRGACHVRHDSLLPLALARVPADDRLHDAAAHVQKHLPFRLSGEALAPVACHERWAVVPGDQDHVTAGVMSAPSKLHGLCVFLTPAE